MSVREMIQSRLATSLREGPAEPMARLPQSLRGDSQPARVGMLKRLAASRTFALGQRAGALRTAQARSGRPFRLDMRQRVIVKAQVSRHSGAGAARGATLARHVAYLGRSGAGVDGARSEFFDREADGLDGRVATRAWSEDRHHFRFIVSPEHGDRIADLRGYVREVMHRVSADLSEPRLEWIATCHFDTDQPHAHVLVRGRRENGRDLVIPRQYVGYGFRARAQEVAQERLGDLSRADAERRVWRETQADRFTGFDRRLIQLAGDAMMLPDSEGEGGAWAALLRGRLLHLETLGLAERHGRAWRLDEQLEPRLRALQISRDVIRTLNEQRLAGGQEVRELTEGRASGVVVRKGFHDELGASPFVVVRDQRGQQHYARLSVGAPMPELGAQIVLEAGARGARVLERGRGLPSLGL
ncbi:MAG: type VI secretion protein [Phenylobacterium zucineum]|nr:MAG: type VI secretion protein [Phenylobacterium zucineum]